MSNNPVQDSIDVLTDTGKTLAESLTTMTDQVSRTKSQFASAVDEALDPQIARRCIDAVDTALTAVSRALDDAYAECESTIRDEVRRLESVL